MLQEQLQAVLTGCQFGLPTFLSCKFRILIILRLFFFFTQSSKQVANFVPAAMARGMSPFSFHWWGSSLRGNGEEQEGKRGQGGVELGQGPLSRLPAGNHDLGYYFDH